MSSSQTTMTITWTLFLLLVSAISLTTSKSLIYGEALDGNNSITIPGTAELRDTLLNSLTKKIDLDKLPDNYENSSSHVEHVGDKEVKVNTNVSHHKTNHSESTKFSQSKVIEGDRSNGFEQHTYQEFSYGGGNGANVEDEELREEAQQQLKLMEKLENIFQEANDEMRELFDDII